MSIASLLPFLSTSVQPLIAAGTEQVSDTLAGFARIFGSQAEDASESTKQASVPLVSQSELTELQNQFLARLQQANVRSQPPLRLKQFGADQVVVDGEHPDRQLVEALFANDPTLRAQFNVIAAQTTADQWRLADLTGRYPGDYRMVVDGTALRSEFE